LNKVWDPKGKIGISSLTERVIIHLSERRC
jgi:hypothetical protein